MRLGKALFFSERRAINPTRRRGQLPQRLIPVLQRLSQRSLLRSLPFSQNSSQPVWRAPGPLPLRSPSILQALPMPLTGLLSNAPPQAAMLSCPFRPQEQILVFNRTWSTGLPFFTLRSETFCRDVQRRARNDDFSIKSATKLGAGTPIRIRRHERRPIHRISASRLQQSARPFCVDSGDLAPLCLITTLGSQTRALSQHQLYL